MINEHVAIVHEKNNVLTILNDDHKCILKHGDKLYLNNMVQDIYNYIQYEMAGIRDNIQIGKNVEYANILLHIHDVYQDLLERIENNTFPNIKHFMEK